MLDESEESEKKSGVWGREMEQNNLNSLDVKDESDESLMMEFLIRKKKEAGK